MPEQLPAAFSAAIIVALGKFDPDLFRLESLVESKVISATEASRSKIKAILPMQVAHLILPWGELVVLPDRFHATATEAPFIRVADLVAHAMNIAGDRCSIRAFGINYETHFDIGSRAARDALAMKFAPPQTWGQWGGVVRESMNSEDPDLHGGLAVITMRERFRAGDVRGWFDVTLSASEKIANHTGVRFLTNHHHEYAPKSPPAAGMTVAELTTTETATLLATLGAAFDDSIGKAERIFTEVLA